MAQIGLWSLLLFVYVVVPMYCMWMPDNSYHMEIYHKPNIYPKETLKDLIQMRRLILRQNLIRKFFDQFGRQSGMRRPKRPFFVQPIAEPVETKVLSPPLKRVVCNGVNDPNCNYLFAFLNRS